MNFVHIASSLSCISFRAFSSFPARVAICSSLRWSEMSSFLNLLKASVKASKNSSFHSFQIVCFCSSSFCSMSAVLAFRLLSLAAVSSSPISCAAPGGSDVMSPRMSSTCSASSSSSMTIPLYAFFTSGGIMPVGRKYFFLCPSNFHLRVVPRPLSNFPHDILRAWRISDRGSQQPLLMPHPRKSPPNATLGNSHFGAS